MSSHVVVDSSGELLLDDFREWLTCQRGLSEVTAYNYCRLVRPFVAPLAAPVADTLAGLDAGEVVSFMIIYCQGRPPATVKSFARSLRSFLRFAHATGVTSNELFGAVPSVAGWHQAS